MRLCMVRYDGSDFHLVSKNLPGTGHPSFEKNMRYIFTDAYTGEPLTLPNGEVPLRLIDTRTNSERTVATMFTLGEAANSILRLDPHPAWSRDGKQVCFNGAPDGRRQLFIADVGKLVG
jgi:Tol biopolymer transport system component